MRHRTRTFGLNAPCPVHSLVTVPRPPRTMESGCLTPQARHAQKSAVSHSTWWFTVCIHCSRTFGLNATCSTRPKSAPVMYKTSGATPVPAMYNGIFGLNTGALCTSKSFGHRPCLSHTNSPSLTYRAHRGSLYVSICVSPGRSLCVPLGVVCTPLHVGRDVFHRTPTFGPNIPCSAHPKSLVTDQYLSRTIVGCYANECLGQQRTSALDPEATRCPLSPKSCGAMRSNSRVSRDPGTRPRDKRMPVTYKIVWCYANGPATDLCTRPRGNKISLFPQITWCYAIQQPGPQRILVLGPEARRYSSSTKSGDALWSNGRARNGLYAKPQFGATTHTVRRG